MQYYGQFKPPVDEIIHSRYFNNKQNGVSIECGAYDGLTENNTKFFEDNYNWKTINIEPLDNAFNKLVLNRPKSINLNLALSSDNKSNFFYNYKHPVLGYEWGNGSICHTETHKNYLEKLCGENEYETKLVECKTYKEIVENLKLTQIDLFILDVEGHEDSVIKGMLGCTVLPDVFVIEHGNTSVDIMKEKLKDLNCSYKIDYIHEVNSYYLKEGFIPNGN